MGSLIPLFWTFGDLCPGFQSQGRFPCLHTVSPMCNGFFRFISGVTPVDLFIASMAAKPFLGVSTLLVSVTPTSAISCSKSRMILFHELLVYSPRSNITNLAWYRYQNTLHRFCIVLLLEKITMQVSANKSILIFLGSKSLHLK